LLMSMTTFCSSDSLFIDHHFNTDLMTHIGTQDRKLKQLSRYESFHMRKCNDATVPLEDSL
ncbi:hypothetical protein T4B_6975, partial [Trichinella pseudospiralis]